MVPYKNPDMWIEVAKTLTGRFKDVSFTWAGDGPLMNALKMKACNNERISLPGVTDDTSAYLTDSVIYYQPSLHETHGIAVLEAMYYALPCVVSDAGGLPESILDGFNGFVVKASSLEAHVEALSLLIENPGLRQEYGRRSRARYLDTFSFDIFKTKMDALYANNQ
jgi:glycosyltransferase involved in cell wall biosynthesis